MNVREIKRRHVARGLRRAAIEKAYSEHLYALAEQDDDWYDDGEDLGCTHCGGEGFAEVDDPLWDDCDEFGYGPCKSCNGTGLRSRQWVF